MPFSLGLQHIARAAPCPGSHGKNSSISLRNGEERRDPSCREMTLVGVMLAWQERQPGMDVRLPAVEVAAPNNPGGRARDHRRIVRAIRECWIGDRHVGPAQLVDFV